MVGLGGRERGVRQNGSALVRRSSSTLTGSTVEWLARPEEGQAARGMRAGR